MKLLAYLQQQGFSRRKITDQIDKGQVFVNGQKIESFGYEIKSGDEIEYAGTKNNYTETTLQDSNLIVFHKPIGYVCSKADPHNMTIYELLPDEFSNYYYIGRLDKDSRGLVLMTNDSKLVDQYEHPRHGITKEYLVTLNKPFRETDMATCIKGIEDAGELLKCVDCKNLNDDLLKKYKDYLQLSLSSNCTVKIILNEGKKRHIRRIMSALRYHVEDLIRIREGDFGLGDLKEREWKIVK